MNLMLMLGLNEILDQMAITNSVHWCGYVLMGEDGHVLRRALDFKLEGQWNKRRPKGTLRKQVGEESMKGGFRRGDVLC